FGLQRFYVKRIDKRKLAFFCIAIANQVCGVVVQCQNVSPKLVFFSFETARIGVNVLGIPVENLAHRCSWAAWIKQERTRASGVVPLVRNNCKPLVTPKNAAVALFGFQQRNR